MGVRAFSLMLMIAAALVGCALVAGFPVEFGLFAVAAASVLILTAKCPEVAFALFLTAGEYKGDPRFQIPHIDLTVLFGIFTALGILWAVMQKRVRPAPPPFSMYFPFLIISCLSALSLMYTVAPVYGLEKTIRFTTLTTLAFFAPLYLFQARGKFKNFLITFIVVALGMLFDMFSKVGLGTREGDAVSAFGSDYLPVGSIMAAAFIIILLYFFLSDRSPARRALYILVFCPLILYGLMVSGARGPLISLVLTLAVIPVVSRRSDTESRRLRVWVLLVLILGGAYFSYTYQEFERMTRRMALFTEGGGASALERINMVKVALEAMSTMPYSLTGLGIGGFSVYYGAFDSVRGVYPHNILLELGSEIGVAGLLAGAFLIAWSLKRGYHVIKGSAGRNYYTAVSAFSVLLCSLIEALKSGDLNDNRLFFAMAGFLYSLDAGLEGREGKQGQSLHTDIVA